MVLVLHPTFDANATTAFLGTPAQLNLEARTIGQLAIEDIANVVDLTDFTKDDIDSITQNFERPQCILNTAGNLVVQSAFTFPMKSQKRLHIVVQLADFYEQMNHQVTPEMMMWF